MCNSITLKFGRNHHKKYGLIGELKLEYRSCIFFVENEEKSLELIYETMKAIDSALRLFKIKNISDNKKDKLREKIRQDYMVIQDFFEKYSVEDKNCDRTYLFAFYSDTKTDIFRSGDKIIRVFEQ